MALGRVDWQAENGPTITKRIAHVIFLLDSGSGTQSSKRSVQKGQEFDKSHTHQWDTGDGNWLIGARSTGRQREAKDGLSYGLKSLRTSGFSPLWVML